MGDASLGTGFDETRREAAAVGGHPSGRRSGLLGGGLRPPLLCLLLSLGFDEQVKRERERDRREIESEWREAEVMGAVGDGGSGGGEVEGDDGGVGAGWCLLGSREREREQRLGGRKGQREVGGDGGVVGGGGGEMVVVVGDGGSGDVGVVRRGRERGGRGVATMLVVAVGCGWFLVSSGVLPRGRKVGERWRQSHGGSCRGMVVLVVRDKEVGGGVVLLPKGKRKEKMVMKKRSVGDGK